MYQEEITDPAKEDEKDAGKGGRRGVVVVVGVVCSAFITVLTGPRTQGNKTIFAMAYIEPRVGVTDDVSDHSHAPRHHLDQAENRVRSNAMLQYEPRMLMNVSCQYTCREFHIAFSI